MFTSLRLERFKNFKDTELKLGPFTVLIGANASGKSNIRDAFRFLHGIAAATVSLISSAKSMAREESVFGRESGAERRRSLSPATDLSC